MYFIPGTEAVQFGVDAGRLGQRVLELADVGDLAADVEVDQLQAIGHVALLEVVEQLEHLGERQAEFRPVTG